jgi:hypothetical protein
MYQSTKNIEIAVLDACGRDPLLRHIGDYKRLVRRNEVQADRAFASAGPDGLKSLWPVLFRRISDARTIRTAIARLDRNKAPGPSGLRLGELEDSELWSLARYFGKAIASRRYRPGPETKLEIPKVGKPGQFRTLTIQSSEDRVVAKALQLILEPIVEPRFMPFSYGFRPQLGRLEALGTALALLRTQGRAFCVAADIANAFDNIPRSRLIAACNLHFPPDVVDLIDLIASTGDAIGIRQGSPVSPLFANIFYHQYIDVPWARRHPETPLIRYADDLLDLCKNADETADAYKALTLLARSAGTPLKPAPAGATVDVSAGQEIEWLGFRLRRNGKRLEVRITDRLWEGLELDLAEAHQDSFSPIRATAIVHGWLDQLGPAWEFENHDAIIHGVRTLAGALAFDELPDSSALLEIGQAAYERWRIVRTNAATALSQHLAAIRKLATAPGPKRKQNAQRSEWDSI